MLTNVFEGERKVLRLFFLTF